MTTSDISKYTSPQSLSRIHACIVSLVIVVIFVFVHVLLFVGVVVCVVLVAFGVLVLLFWPSLTLALPSKAQARNRLRSTGFWPLLGRLLKPTCAC